ncbi:Protein of unknown function (DUF2993) [Chthonomonas calidirosea]|uniref:DUF2993 domain-containing protein n=1 Tax=Chthonomonas calidirosea (strain DSM 23976 / ICMP 18418 / T49) TaxID=1303518 RepID=S0EVC2_CHTCT|nr:DUF2993 domain-containing protein [Chthonomonas calidirosea]CCW35703.1 Protein of unknown function (DUF2993) [Chthonomonas calidirosea T49]CEK19488.1 Protein of unknown function (DUF2993) [Chthonomonas calidirosea]
MISFECTDGQVRLHHVALQLPQLPGILHVDEVTIELASARFELDQAGGLKPQLSADLISVVLVLSEVTLNSLLRDFTPPSAPVRELRIRLLSGKTIVDGKFLPAQKNLYLPFLSNLLVPFTAEVVPAIASTTQIRVELKSVRTGFALPEMAVQHIERLINELPLLSLHQLPFPVVLQDIRCEPGRLIVRAAVQFSWPFVTPSSPQVATAPFSLTSLPTPSDKANS